MKLNQAIAIEKGIKKEAYALLTDADKTKGEAVNGFVKTYRPVDEDAEKLPEERKLIQTTVEELLGTVRESHEELFDVVATKEWGNTQALGDVILEDGTTLFEGVPVTYLLFLEKQIRDFRTFVERLPVLNPAERWERDVTDNLWKTAPVDTHRTKKVPKAVTLAEPTEHHPAQVQLIYEDVLAGYWTTVKHSGAISKIDREGILNRLNDVEQAVKKAREEANGIEVDKKELGERFFNFLLGA